MTMTFNPEYASNIYGYVRKSIPRCVYMYMRHWDNATALHESIFTVRHYETGPRWWKGVCDKSLVEKKAPNAPMCKNSAYTTVVANEKGDSHRYQHSCRDTSVRTICLYWKDPEDTATNALRQRIRDAGIEDNFDFCFLSSWVFGYLHTVYLVLLNKWKAGPQVDKNLKCFSKCMEPKILTRKLNILVFQKKRRTCNVLHCFG